MITIDSTNMLAMSADDVCRRDTSQVSSTKAFRDFAAGIHMTEELLEDDRWQGTRLSTTQQIFGLVMAEMLPVVYDLHHLEKLGGTFALRVTDIADYTLTAINKRVVVFNGLPVDVRTGEDVIDLEIAPDVLLAYCRGLMLDFSEHLLSEDDEDEDRLLSDMELGFAGVPAGGRCYSKNCGSKNTNSCSSKKNEPPRCYKKHANNSGGTTNTGPNASACGANASPAGTCATNASACGANISTGICTTNASACAANGSSNNCTGNASACAAKYLSSNCAANASACGAKFDSQNCAANASACGANFGGHCAGNAAACGVKLTAGCAGDVGACAVDILPYVPSC